MRYIIYSYFFYGKSNENGFRYLRDMLATMMDVNDSDQKE